jgi:hypothetical protein
MKYKGARHGDVDLIPLRALPENLKKVEYKKDFVLAEGEVTGHKHKLLCEPETVSVYQDEQGRYFLDIKQPTKITHEEHGTRTLTPGFYVREIEEEYDVFEEELKNVID